MSHGRKLLAALVLTLAVGAAGAAGAGCDHRPEDFTRTRAQASAFHDTWKRRIAEAEVRHARLAERARPLAPDTAGLPEAQAQLAALRSRLDNIVDRAAALRGDIGGHIDAKQRRLAEAAVARGNKELEAELAGVLTELDTLTRTVDKLEGAAAQAKQASADAAASAAAAAAGPDILEPSFARTVNATADVDVEFVTGGTQLDIERSKVVLDKLVQLAQSCAQLKLRVTAHVSATGDADGDALSVARGEALGRYLQGRGVATSKLETAGAGAREPRAPEVAAPGAPAVDPDHLAALQELNRRVTVTVIRPCTST